MSKYKCLIFDVDNTILMYDKSAHVAIKIFLEGFKIANRPDYEKLFVDVCNENNALEVLTKCTKTHMLASVKTVFHRCKKEGYNLFPT